MKEAIQAYCPQCRSRCGVICEVEDGRLVKIRKDPEHPNRTNLCPKGIAGVALVYHPERLKYPMKRSRPKTDQDPGWRRVSWDEALETIAERLTGVKEAYGAEAVVFGKGSSSGTAANDYKEWVARLALAFGTPNANLATTHICNWHRDKGSAYTYGVGLPAPDFENAKCILLWGHNPDATWRRYAEEISRARKRGAKIILIDPRRNETFRQGDLWLPVRPGTDQALALGMLHVAIEERLYDDDFTKKWTNAPFLLKEEDASFLRERDIRSSQDTSSYLAWGAKRNGPIRYDPETRRFLDDDEPILRGVRQVGVEGGGTIACQTVFERLAHLVSQYPPEAVEGITWVPAERVREAARLFYTNRPSCYYTYNGIEQHTNAMQTNRAVCILYALTGDFDRPGGNVLFPVTKVRKVDDPGEFSVKKPPLGKDKRPLGPSSVQAGDLYRAVLEEEPYAVKGLVSFGGNLLMSCGDARRAKKALEKLDFFVAVDFFETPTARLADILLPAATPWEAFFIKPTFEGDARTSTYLQLKPPIIQPLHEARPDISIIFELAKRLGLGDRFWNGDIEAAFNAQLSPSRVTVEDLRKSPGGLLLPAQVNYRKYQEENGRNGLKGFNTPSGRIEVYSERFLKNGYNPLPGYEEPLVSAASRPELADRYPFVLTCKKLLPFCHSQHRALPTLRRLAPDPYVEINAGRAEEMGINEGDWVKIETPLGRIRVKAKLTPHIHPRVVCAQHGWWQGCKDLGLPAFEPLGEAGANFNLLISNDVRDPITGCVPHKSYICNIVKDG